MRRVVFFLSICCAAAVCLFSQAEAAERILHFRSDIEVDADGAMLVTETITVNAEGAQIKRGIYRDFPTRYKDRLGNSYVVEFEVLGVQRNGADEPWRRQRQGNGVRVYIGDKDRYLPAGVYTYILTYRTDRQLGFFAAYDELYWNVTGNGWSFPIDLAEAYIRLPGDAAFRLVSSDAYTGPAGAQGKDFSFTVDSQGTVIFSSTRIFAAGEGLTVAVSFPKGYVREPDAGAKFGYFVRDNRALLVLLFGIALVLVYYLLTWHHFGRDPQKGVVIPLFSAPKGFTPQQMRHIMRMGFDHKTLTACVLSLAVKGYLTVTEEAGTFTLAKTTGQVKEKLSHEEQAVADALFGGGGSIELKNTNHSRISKAIDILRDTLNQDAADVYFLTNQRYRVAGIVLSGLVVLPAVLTIPEAERMALTGFMAVWLGIWSVGVFALGAQVVSLWKGYIRSRNGLRVAGAVLVTLFALPFFIGEIVGLGMFVYAASPAVAAGIVLLGLVNLLFFHLLKAPTVAGRMVMDKFEGFRMYLGTAEKERLNMLNAPDKTPALFEKYLPYAFALDVEQQWSEKFSEVLKQASDGGQGYHPYWYHGGSWSSAHPARFASSFGSALSGAISSSSRAPGSSSGGFGGGSSGGGGGGGGGGGW